MNSISVARRVPLVGLLAATLAACGGDVAAPVTEPYVTSFDRLWSTVDRQYSYFPIKGVDWDSVSRAARPRAAAITTDEEFVALVSHSLSTLRDVHVWLVSPDGTTHGTWRSPHPANWSEATLNRQLRSSGWVNESPAVGHRTIDGIGYIALRSWNARAFAVADFDRALDRHRGAPALVVDVRMNAGGDDALATQVAARFTDVGRVASYVQYRSGRRHTDYTPIAARRVEPRGSWHFTRPIVLLIGRGSWSATESFVSAMREFPNVTVVGDTTGGGSGNPALYSLRAGWGVSLSRWIEYTARGEVIEGRGIAPDLVVPVSARALVEGRDETLDAALALARRASLTTRRSER